MTADFDGYEEAVQSFGKTVADLAFAGDYLWLFKPSDLDGPLPEIDFWGWP